MPSISENNPDILYNDPSINEQHNRQRLLYHNEIPKIKINYVMAYI